MPKILIIDNTTVHLPRLIELVEEKIPDPKILIEVTNDLKSEHVRSADLVILSGGTGRSVEKNTEMYNRVVGLAVKNNKPTVGICLGAEAIAVYFGAKLEQMPVRRVGNIPLSLNKGNWKRKVGNRPMVYEFHKWKITNIIQPLLILATSKDGPEIFKHNKQPMYGLQFHPEVRRNDNQGHLFLELILKDILKGHKITENLAKV